MSDGWNAIPTSVYPCSICGLVPLPTALVDIFLPKAEADAIILGDDRLERRTKIGPAAARGLESSEKAVDKAQSRLGRSEYNLR
jgi:hypothetical protein